MFVPLPHSPVVPRRPRHSRTCGRRAGSHSTGAQPQRPRPLPLVRACAGATRLGSTTQSASDCARPVFWLAGTHSQQPRTELTESTEPLFEGLDGVQRTQSCRRAAHGIRLPWAGGPEVLLNERRNLAQSAYTRCPWRSTTTRHRSQRPPPSLRLTHPESRRAHAIAPPRRRAQEARRIEVRHTSSRPGPHRGSRHPYRSR